MVREHEYARADVGITSHRILQTDLVHVTGKEHAAPLVLMLDPKHRRQAVRCDELIVLRSSADPGQG